MDATLRIALAVVLLSAAAAKIRERDELPDVLAAYGVPAPLRVSLAAALVVVEASLGALLLVGALVTPAALAAMALGVVFVAAATRARLGGIRRIRCGCFGARERSTAFVLVRAVAFTALAVATVAVLELDPAMPSRETLVYAALAVLTLAVVALGALVLALYRQVGVLSLRISPRAALELAEEGPEVGRAAPPLVGLERRGSELVAFFSENCRLCRELEPAVRALAREGLPVRVVYEEEDAAATARWNVPGAPFVVHTVDGVVAAKGLVNTLEQLDDVVATGTARRQHAAA